MVASEAGGSLSRGLVAGASADAMRIIADAERAQLIGSWGLEDGSSPRPPPLPGLTKQQTEAPAAAVEYGHGKGAGQLFRQPLFQGAGSIQ